MMSLYFISAVSAYSIVIATVLGIKRFRKIDRSYYPFIYICWLGFINETTSIITAHVFHNNAVNLNIYVLLDALLFLWQFYKWDELRSRKKIYCLLGLLFLFVWILDNFILNSFLTINSLFRIIYSFVLVFLSINAINKLLFTRREKLMRDARFLICIGVIFFYSYKAVFEIFYLSKLNFSNNFYNHVHLVLEAVNVISNLLYAWAILRIPKRQNFVLPF